MMSGFKSAFNRVSLEIIRVKTILHISECDYQACPEGSRRLLFFTHFLPFLALFQVRYQNSWLDRRFSLFTRLPMPSSTHYVYRELEEMIAKNRVNNFSLNKFEKNLFFQKAIGASCDFSQSRWVCGTKKGGVKEGPIYEGAFTMVRHSLFNQSQLPL